MIKNPRWFNRLNSVSQKLRLVSAGSLVVAAVALGLSSFSTKPTVQFSENHRGSAAFLKHTEDLFAAKVGAAGEKPASWADQNYQLNGGDQITAGNISGARAAFSAIQKKGLGQAKTSTGSWFSLGPTNAIYPAFLNRHGSQYVTSGRITALAIAPTCTTLKCTVWVAAAGGGVWKTDKALAGNANWVNVSDGFFMSGAIGALTYDAANSTLYAGTGEDAATGDAEAGVGVYKSTDGGANWTPLGGNSSFTNRAIRTIAIDNFNDPSGNTIYVTSGRGVHGISSTTAGAVSQIPGGPGVGVWKSTDGGANFTLAQPTTVVLGPNPGQTFPSTFGSTRGATALAVDPTHAGVIYATAYQKGVWRSTDSGATWANIHASLIGSSADRSEFALATTNDGHTRMYQTEGDSGVDQGQPYSRFWVAEAVESGTPTFVQKTSENVADPGYATYNVCTGQCWYDQRVVSPAGHPDTVFVLGSYTYDEDHRLSNARAVLLSTDGGNTFTDETDAALLPDGTLGTDASHVGLHPDQHAFAVNPNNPNQFFEGSDGGLMRSDGTFTDISSRCGGRGLDPVSLARCQQLLSRAPTSYTSLNNGLQTLQFQSLSVNPANAKDVQGGTQDNGTFETTGSSVTWPQTIFGSGGAIGWISRTISDSSTLWASTTTGRLFISKNADAAPASAVTFTRLDTLDPNAPNRAISSISIDPANPNHAYVSYLSYNELVANLGQTAVPGHVFSVTYDTIAGTATWANLEGTGTPIGNQPVNSVAFDNVSGDLYASTDFGVVRLAGANAANGWTMAAPGLPVVTVAGLTINPGARQLLAATHGRGAYQLTLP